MTKFRIKGILVIIPGLSWGLKKHRLYIYIYIYDLITLNSMRKGKLSLSLSLCGCWQLTNHIGLSKRKIRDSFSCM